MSTSLEGTIALAFACYGLIVVASLAWAWLSREIGRGRPVVPDDDEDKED